MRRIAVPLACLVLAAAVVAAPAGSAAPEPVAATTPAEPAYYSLVLPAGVTVADLVRAGYDIGHGHRSRPMVVATPEEAARLRDRGITLGKVGTVYRPVSPATDAAGTTYYGGYHTSAGHEQHNAEVAAAHPDLVRLYDIGDSWKKTKGHGGHDIQALCISKLVAGDCALSSTGQKPKFVLHAQIHAREVVTGELAYRWIDLLVSSYGKDPAITSLMDTRELWVVPMANPDGVDVVASSPSRPVLQRKNVNDSVGGCPAAEAGVDLNRNSGFQWDPRQGGPCDETYPGAKAVSEPETIAVQGLLDKLFRDTKGDVGEPAAADTTGVFLSLHSYGNDILAPYGYTNTAAPNRAALIALGKKMGALNGYPVSTGDGGVGYFAPGATDDWLYGTRGVASYTFEVGDLSGTCGGFLPAYRCVDSTFWPKNKAAFLYAAKAAAAPYGTLP
ncbi:peptidase M14 carboxypeptidase A [Kribbella flavida DSM 17836]|uniref:Peptidase M14 carboxypeptidase A n=1 Tax=Kribbella flavida (strain DSM 17836 / JCM 10339 / NBRC 14399) TaxID=479435 RepID=D2Q1V2_KRIFD|nr:M14 family zinc carboxypeptidase [Kribbella flavida]ADB32091.1 peptidase M14 carboxypeptidase A [Kribbella flavida DSM 17836]